MPNVPRGSSLLSRSGTGSTPGILPGDPLGGIPAAGNVGFLGARRSDPTGSAFIAPQFEPFVREQFSLFDRLGQTDLQPLQARAFQATRDEFSNQLSRFLETQGGGGAKPRPRGASLAKGQPRVFIADSEAVERLTILGEAARAAITGLRTEPVKFRAKGGLITRRRGIV